MIYKLLRESPIANNKKVAEKAVIVDDQENSTSAHIGDYEWNLSSKKHFSIYGYALLMMAITQVQIGMMNVSRCDVSALLPLWQVAFGLVLLLEVLIRYSIDVLKTNGRLRKLLRAIECCLVFATFILIASGTMTLIRVFGKVSNDPNSEDFCDPITFYCAFGVISSIYFICLLAVVYGFTLCTSNQRIVQCTVVPHHSPLVHKQLVKC